MENQLPGTPGQPTTPYRINQHTKPSPVGPARTRRPRWPTFIGLGFLGLLVVALIAFFGLNIVLEGQYTNKIEPGVSISGVYVGEMSRDEAKTKILKALEGYTQKPVVLSFKDKTWNPTLEQLGVTINLDDTLNKAADFNKEGLRVFKLLNPESTNLPIEIMMDEAKLNGFLTDISDRIRLDPVEPEVKIDPTGQLITTEGKIGFNVDYDATLNALKKTLGSLTPTDENLLKVHDVAPVIGADEVDSFKKALQPYLNGPVTVSYQDKSWTFDQKTIAAQLKLNINPDKKEPKHLGYTFDTAYFENYLTDLGKTINQAARDGVVGWVNGKVGFTKPSQDGQFLSVPRTMDNLNQAFVATDPEKRKTTLWVDVKEPALSSKYPERLGKFEVIGEGVSSFGGSASSRATNIKVGAQHLSGAIVKPHTVFSFLDAIGDISEKAGYVSGFSIVADQTVPDVGGGICQVATTTFRAAFYAGLPIVERNPHAYRVSWYEEMGEPVGFDAAVYQPGVDFKFENNSDYYMAVTAMVDSGKLYVRVLGNKIPGQKVSLIANEITNVKDAPPDRIEVDPSLKPGQKVQYDSAHKGLTTSITRVISIDGKEVKRTTFPSVYAPWPNIYKVGPTPKPDPTPTPKPTDSAKPDATPATPTPKA
jgi:vancomycin resistance protein YoaR